MTTESAVPRRSSPAALARAAGLLAIVLVAAGGPLVRLGVLPLRVGVALLYTGAVVGLTAVVLGMTGARKGRVMHAVPAMVLGLLAFSLGAVHHLGGRGAAPLHDVTTDVANPPAFLAAARGADGAETAYPGDAAGALQREAYPDIQPVIVPVGLDSAFTTTLATVRGLGWEVVDANPDEGRIEATATSSGWWGLRSDVVARIQPASGVARVDVRARSRTDGADRGDNARHVRAFLNALQEKTGRLDL